jgi:hypothetical protein
LRVEVIRLYGTDPNVFGDRDVEPSSDGESEGGVVAGGQLAGWGGEVAVETVYSSKERLAEGLVVGVIGDAHTKSTHAIEEAESGVEARDVAGGVAPGLDDG